MVFLLYDACMADTMYSVFGVVRSFSLGKARGLISRVLLESTMIRSTGNRSKPVHIKVPTLITVTVSTMDNLQCETKRRNSAIKENNIPALHLLAIACCYCSSRMYLDHNIRKVEKM